MRPAANMAEASPSVSGQTPTARSRPLSIGGPVRPRHLPQHLVDPALPAGATLLEILDHLGAQPDGDLLVRILLRRPTQAALDALGQGREGLGEGAGLGKLLVGGLGDVGRLRCAQ